MQAGHNIDANLAAHAHRGRGAQGNLPGRGALPGLPGLGGFGGHILGLPGWFGSLGSRGQLGSIGEVGIRGGKTAETAVALTTRGDIALLAEGNITATSQARFADTRIGHTIYSSPADFNGFLARGDVRIATNVGDITFDADRGSVSVGHDVPALSLLSIFDHLDDWILDLKDDNFELPKPFGNIHGDIIVVAGGAVGGGSLHGGNINVGGAQGAVHVGHGHGGHLHNTLSGDVAMVADLNLTIAGNHKHRARIGHGGFLGFAKNHNGVILLAWDQLLPGFDTTGRFYMNGLSTIDSKQRVLGNRGLFVINPKNLTILIGTRRGPFNGPPNSALGVRLNVIEDGAVINGIPFNSGQPMGERSTAFLPWYRGWNINTEFQNAPAEKWGFSFFDLVNNPSLGQLLASADLDLNLGALAGSYEGPFTFYYLPFFQHSIFDYDYYHRIPYWVDGVGEGCWIPVDAPRDEEEITGESNYQAFGL